MPSRKQPQLCPYLWPFNNQSRQPDDYLPTDKTYRSESGSILSFSCTQGHRLAAGPILVDWLQSHSQRAAVGQKETDTAQVGSVRWVCAGFAVELWKSRSRIEDKIIGRIMGQSLFSTEWQETHPILFQFLPISIEIDVQKWTIQAEKSPWKLTGAGLRNYSAIG